MTKRIIQCLSHAIESYQQLDLLTSLGYEVVDFGPYIDPAHPHVDIRPPLPGVPTVQAMVDAYEDTLPDDPQARIPDKALEWLGDDGIIIFHHYLEKLYADWPRIHDWMEGSPERRVIWRSVGQSVANNERIASPYRISGLERVAYSPREANIPGYSGHDAVIRFWGYPEERPWTGTDEVVIQVSQDLRQRDPYSNWAYWDSATRGLPRMPIGPGSEIIGGLGKVDFETMRARLLSSRAFLFTGTQPASYTLGLVEAMHAGIPTVSIGPKWMRIDYGGHTSAEMFEGHELAVLWSDDPNVTRHMLRNILRDDEYATNISRATKAHAERFFDRETVGREWAEFLG